jgi:PleD family two-component response regulator
VRQAVLVNSQAKGEKSMQSVHVNLVENQFTQPQQNENLSPVASVTIEEVAGGKGHTDKQAAAADAMYAAFAWLFGSGCF